MVLYIMYSMCFQSLLSLSRLTEPLHEPEMSGLEMSGSTWFRLRLPWSVMPLLPERDAAQASSKLSNQKVLTFDVIKANEKGCFLKHPEDASTARAGHQLPRRETVQERHCHSESFCHASVML